MLEEISLRELDQRAELYLDILMQTYGDPKKYIERFYKRAYKTVYIPKKDGTMRRLDIPDDTLKEVQRAIMRDIFYKLSPSMNVHSYTSGLSPVTNAMMHLGKPYVIQVDIKDFFPNIGYAKVEKILLNIFTILSGQKRSDIIWSHGETLDIFARIVLSYDPKYSQYFLPQGAPTSPVISNFALPYTDRHLKFAIEAVTGDEVIYTRYSDNITVSFNHSSNIRDILRILNAIISKDGFKLNRKKTKISGPKQRKVITGVSISSGDHLTVPRSKYRLYRAIVHNIASKDHITYEDYMRVKGIMAWIGFVNPEKLPYFERKLDIIEAKLFN